MRIKCVIIIKSLFLYKKVIIIFKDLSIIFLEQEVIENHIITHFKTR